VVEQGAVHIVSLGGLGEIGRNCMLLEQADDAVMIDCGVSFPFDDNGVDLVHPRFDVVLRLQERFRGVVLTHGHEDHIGGLPFLLRRWQQAGGGIVDITGPRHALALARRRIAEAELLGAAQLNEVAVGERYTLGSFGIESLPVTHSIPQATALCIDTVAGRIIHTGDFKLDPCPGDGAVTDETRLSAIGDAGVALLMSDSTNVLSEGHSVSEKVVAEGLQAAIASAPHRVVVGVFASNVHWLRALGAAAQAAGRRLCLLGRSVRTHADLARELGMLSWPSDLVVHPDRAAELPRAELLCIASGTQGQPRSALRRLASGTHNALRLAEGDLVLLSSRVIPGNERATYAMIDDLLALGVAVQSRLDGVRLHASGHAHRDEQRRMIELTRPQSFVPIHGTRQHLERHASLARQVGVEHALVALDGQRMCLTSQGLAIDGTVDAGKVAVAGSATAPVEVSVELLRQRRQLARSGLVVVAVHQSGGEQNVEVTMQGVSDDEEVVRQARQAAFAVLGGAAFDGESDAVKEQVRVAVRRRVASLVGHKPPVQVVMLGL